MWIIGVSRFVPTKSSQGLCGAEGALVTFELSDEKELQDLSCPNRDMSKIAILDGIEGDTWDTIIGKELQWKDQTWSIKHFHNVDDTANIVLFIDLV